VGDVHPAGTRAFQVKNGQESEMIKTSFINFDNNNRLPLIRLGFFDVLGNKRGSQPGWTYSCQLSIPSGANKEYNLASSESAGVVQFALGSDSDEKVFQNEIRNSASLVIMGANGSETFSLEFDKVVIVGNEQDEKYTTTPPTAGSVVTLPQTQKIIAGQWTTVQFNLRSEGGKNYA